jgi:hypothetical protein
VSVGSVDTSSSGLTATDLLRPKTAQLGAAAVTDDTKSKSSTAVPPPGSANALASQDTQSAQDELEDQIRAERAQLNDWATCVSASTPQGKAEIRSLSTQISAAQEQIDHLPQTTGAAAGSATASVDLWA